MAYNPVSGAAVQYSKDNGEVASGYWLKFYIANTTTPLSMAVDSTGASLLVKCKLNDKGYPISNENDNTTVFIPHVNQAYRFVLYVNETDADNNTTANADVNIPKVSSLLSTDDGVITPFDSIVDLPTVVIGNRVSVTGYHAGTTVGGGDAVGVVGRHDGVINFDPTRSAEIGTAAYYVDSGIDADCWKRIGIEYVTPEMAGATGADQYEAIQAASNAAGTGKLVFQAGGSYTLASQLNPPAGQTIVATGATIKWTAFGSTLATDVDEAAATGNGVRLSSNTTVDGGTWQMDGVTTPSNVSIPSAWMSGAFWNMFVIGHFNSITTVTPEIAVSNVKLFGVKTEILSGDRSSAILGSGLINNIVIEDFEDDASQSSGGAAGYSGMEFTWGSGVIADSTYHPHDLTLNRINVKGFNLSSYEGLRFSGCYDVSVKAYRSQETQEALTFYIGDPGTNPINGNAAQDSSRIGTGLYASDIVCDKFNVGIQILGDGNGSTHTDRKTNLLDLNISDYTLIGNGKNTNTGPWSSNTGISANSARGYTIGTGTIRECYEAGIANDSSTGGAFTTPNEIEVDGVHIYNIGKSGIDFNKIEDSKFSDLKIHNTNESGSTPNASVNLEDAVDNTIIDCNLGKVGDSTRVSINCAGTSSGNHVIRTNTFEESAGVYIESAANQLVIHGDCTDTGAAETGAKRFSEVSNAINTGSLTPTSSLVSGSLTVNGTNAIGDTEAAAASDDFDDLVFSGAKIGDVVFITPASSSRTLNVRHAAGAAGTQTRTKSGAAEAMTGGFTMFMYDGNAWWKTN